MSNPRKIFHLLFIATMLSSSIIMLSCERENTDTNNNTQNEEQNIFVGKWVLKDTIDTQPSGTSAHYVYNLDYTLTIANDNRCKLEGTNTAHGSYNSASGTRTFTISKDALYLLENPKEITFYGVTFSTEDGIKFANSNGYLLKNDNTLTMHVQLTKSSSTSFGGSWGAFTSNDYEVEFVRI